jgi:hypothetical protein
LSAKAGRPPKATPNLGDPLVPGMSRRDIAIACGKSRQYVDRCIAYADLPEDVFEELLVAGASPREIELVARSRAGKSTQRVRICPHCGEVLWIEGRDE